MLREVILALLPEFREAPEETDNTSPTSPFLQQLNSRRKKTENYSLLTPQLTDIENAFKRTSLAGVKEFRWSDLLAPGSSP